MTVRIDITKEEIEALAVLMPWKAEQQGVSVDGVIESVNQVISEQLEESDSKSKWL